MTDDDDYKVGYRRPPIETQFKPGQSGSPKARKGKRDLSFRALIDRMLARRVTIKVEGKPKRMTMLDAIVLRQVAAAAKGDFQATGLLLLLKRHLQRTGETPGFIIRIEGLDH